MLRAKTTSNLSKPKHKSFKLAHATFTVPALAVAGLAALGVSFIDYNPEDFASASNSSTVTGTISYADQYITISNSSVIDLGNAEVTADSSYVYATDNVTVSTNVPTGYELYLTSANKESSNLTTPSSYTTIPATSGTGGESGTPAVLDENTYGYAVPSSLINNNNFDTSYASPTPSSKWAAVPAGTQDRIRTTNTANTAGDTTDVHYGANVNNALAPGQYSGSVIYSAVATPTEGNIEMSVNPSSGIYKATLTITSGPTTIASSTQLANDEVEIYFRQNGVTKGSCTVSNVNVFSSKVVTTCTPTDISGGNTYDVVVSIPRYGFKDMKSSGYITVNTLQEFTATKCQALTKWTGSTQGTTTTLYDARNMNSYSVRYLADGHCWMVQDLNIVNKTISSTDSDLTSGTFTIPASTSGSSNWCKTDSADCDDVKKVHVGTVIDSYWKSGYGPYYNWFTATAGSGTYSTSSGSVNTSICPKGWKLPLGTTDSYSWYYLFNTSYGGDQSNFLTASNTGSGYWAGYYGGSLSSAGNVGRWWSRTANNSSYAYSLYTGSNSITPQYNNNKYGGNSIRCVFVGS